MTNEEAIQVLHHIIQVADTSDCGIKEIDGIDEEALDMAIKALEQEPCDDCISRQDAIDAIDALYLNGDSSASFRASADGDALIGKYQAITALDDLPPVTPQQKIGRWILTMPRGAEEWCYKCSKCGFWKYKKTIDLSKFNYCPNCGQSKMQEVEE